MRRLAAEAGLDLDSIWIPERGARPSPPSLGPHVGAADDTLFVFDGKALRLETIADAVGLASQLVVPVSRLEFEPQREERGVPVLVTRPSGSRRAT